MLLSSADAVISGSLESKGLYGFPLSLNCNLRVLSDFFIETIASVAPLHRPTPATQSGRRHGGDDYVACR